MTRLKSTTLFVIGFVTFAAGCRRSHAREAPAAPATVPFQALKITEPAYEGGLKGDWMDFGWVDHASTAGKPAAMSFANHGGWILYNPHLKTNYGGLRFAYRTKSAFGDFLEVRFDSKSANIYPRVRVLPAHTRGGANGFTEVFVSTAELNPQGLAFDRVVIRAIKDVPDEPIDFDHVGLTEPDVAHPLAGKAVDVGPGQPVTLAIQCHQPGHAISPLIYGIAYAPRLDSKGAQQFELGATVRRWGGNIASRYNWELGNAWNAGSDYFYRNLDYTGVPGFTYETFLQDQLVRGLKTALTVPAIGYVAKDTKAYGFPTSTFGGAQQEMDPDTGLGGNGLNKKGAKLESGPPELTSIAAPPEFVARWVHAIRAKDAKRGRTVDEYILDNEPALWNDTHRDLHPKPTSYDELLDRTLRYGAAIRKEDPDAVIAGPAEWGWPAYFASALDQTNGNADRRAHGEVPLIPWLLRNVHAYELKNRTKILNVLDVHFYPQAKGVGSNTQGRTDAEGSALRLRSTRALWDPGYRDESWIGERIELIPRLKRWIAENDPGLGISIGEWNFGAEQHMSGGLAVAEVLGRFGEQGLYSAFYWTYPPSKSPASWAFRAFRNYDGKGGHFLETSVPTKMTEKVSLFASRDSSGKMVAVILNLDPDHAADATVELQGCEVGTRVKRVFSYDGDEKGFAEALPPTGAGVHLKSVAPYSITVLEMSP